MPAVVGGVPRRDVLFGRATELDRVGQAVAAAVLVSGDSGIGKSEVLRTAHGGAAAPASGSSDRLRSAPVQVARRPGALQGALLEALSEVVAAVESAEPGYIRAGGLVRAAVERASEARLNDMAAAAWAVVVGVIRAHAGDEVADAIVDVSAELGAAREEQLVARIKAQADPDALLAIALLAGEVCERTGRSIVLSLDGVERLTGDDSRGLVDFVEGLPEKVHLILGMATRSAADSDRAHELAALGCVDHVPLGPLSGADVERWFVFEGLDVHALPGGLEEVMRVTGGYPLYVDAALGAAQQGVTLGGLRGEAEFVRLVGLNYASLGPADQRAVMLLAAFSDPPAEDILLDLVGMDAVDWAVQESRLVAARLLAAVSEGRPWFHEIARRALWENVLSPGQRTVSAERALRALFKGGRQGRAMSVQDCVDLSRLAQDAPDLIAKHEGATEFLTLGADELAIFAALIELEEATNGGVLETGVVVRHAAHRFSAAGDLHGRVRDLESRGLLFLQESVSASVVAALWGSSVAKWIAVGSIATTSGRVPLPGVASAVFGEFVSPLVQPFSGATVGVGAPSFTSLSELLRDMRVPVDDGSDVHELGADEPAVRDPNARGRGADASSDVTDNLDDPDEIVDDDPWLGDEDEDESVESHTRALNATAGLLIRARLSDLDLYGAVGFDSVEDRDAALDRLRPLVAGVVDSGERFIVDTMVEWPARVVLPTRRFTSALNLALGEAPDGYHVKERSDAMPELATLDDAAEAHVGLMRVLRQMSSPLERHALNLDRSTGVVYAESERGSLVGTVIGGDEAVRLDLPVPLVHTRMFSELEGAAALGPGQSLKTVSYRARYNHQNPVPRLVVETSKQIARFNQAQRAPGGLYRPLSRIVADERALTDALQIAHDQRLEDARALVEARVVPRPGPSLASHVYLLVVLNLRDDPDGAGLGRLRRWAYVHELIIDTDGITRFPAGPTGAHENLIVARIVDSSELPTSTKDYERAFFEPFFDLPDFDETQATFSTSGSLDGIAHRLGHERVTIEWPQLRDLPKPPE